MLAVALTTEARTLIFNLRCERTTVCTDSTVDRGPVLALPPPSHFNGDMIFFGRSLGTDTNLKRQPSVTGRFSEPRAKNVY